MPLVFRSLPSRNAFTLIEILIVIAIIALLAAILFPAFSSSREMARRSTCASNLKQIGLAFQQYVADYDNIYPTFYGLERSSSGFSRPGWTQSLHPYLKSAHLFQCPTESQEANPRAAEVASLIPPGFPYIFYGFTDYFYNQNFSIDCEPYYTISCRMYGGVVTAEAKLSSPTQTILLGDSSNGPQSYAIMSPDFTRSNAYKYESNGNAIYPYTEVGVEAAVRHSGGANYAFADGHVKWLKYTSISPGYTGLHPRSEGWSFYPNRLGGNAMPPSKLQAPYQATFAITDY